MNHANNMESMGFERSGWSLIEEINNDNGQTIYMGKAIREDAATNDYSWIIKRIMIVDDGDVRNTEVKMASGYNRWDDRASLEYLYL